MSWHATGASWSTRGQSPYRSFLSLRPLASDQCLMNGWTYQEGPSRQWPASAKPNRMEKGGSR
eukprot:scaffold654867_cov57-Prasinocladus_malaysianus.AAC.1